MATPLVHPGDTVYANDINANYALLDQYKNALGDNPAVFSDLKDAQDETNRLIAQGGKKGTQKVFVVNQGGGGGTSGGATDAHNDVLLARGQQLKAQSFSVVVASDHTPNVQATLYPNNAAGSYNRHKSLHAAPETNKVTIQGVGVVINSVDMTNYTSTWRYVKVYNLASVTASTDLPSYVFPIAPNTSRSISFSIGLRLGTAFTVLLSKVDGRLSSGAPVETGAGVDAHDMEVNFNYVTT